MKKAQLDDLLELTDILEGFRTKLETMTEADQIDLAARLKPVAKSCELIDDFVKDGIKERLKHKEGVRQGNLFKAVLKLVKVSRLDQKALKEQKPALAAQFTNEGTDERISFELR